MPLQSSWSRHLTLLAAALLVSSCATRQGPVSREVMNYSEDLDRGIAGNPSVQDLRFDWPVREARMTRGFFLKDRKVRRPHLGLDLAASKGTPILSAHQGIVIYAGRDFRGFGNMILIENGYGWATLYAHLDRFLVREGERIRQGQVIGAMGRTGRATGVHLHFEIRKNRAAIDPLPLLPAGPELISLYRAK